MKLSPNTLTGAVVAAALVGAGVWHASDPDSIIWSYLAAGRSVSRPLVYASHVDWSADGKQLLLQFRNENEVGAHLALHQLDSAGTNLQVDPLGDPVSVSALAPDGRHVLIGSFEGRLWWIDPLAPTDPEPVIDLQEMTPFTAVAISEGSRLLAAGDKQGAIHLYDTARTSAVVIAGEGARSSVASLRFSRDGKRLAAAQHDGRISIWDLTSGELIKSLSGHDGTVRAAEFLPPGDRLISAGEDGTVRIWELATGQELWRREFGLAGINTLAVSEDGGTGAVGGNNGRIVVWDIEQGKNRFQIKLPTRVVIDLKFSPDGSRLAVASAEHAVRLYNMTTAAQAAQIQIPAAEGA